METFKPKITVQTAVTGDVETVWKLWTTPACVAQWNNPTDNWQTPKVEIDLKDGGSFVFRMELKDGSFGFDFCGTYDKIITNQLIAYTVSDGRTVVNTFSQNGNDIIVTETFEPEAETSLEKQKEFCQKVLNNFKKYAESNSINL